MESMTPNKNNGGHTMTQNNQTNNQQVETFFGKGEYALTSKNTAKLINHVRNYNATGKWVWALVDCIGIRQDGKFGNRYHAILGDPVVNEKCPELIEVMKQVPERKPEEIKRTYRDSYPNAQPVDKKAAALQGLKRASEELSADEMLKELLGEEMAKEILHKIS